MLDEFRAVTDVRMAQLRGPNVDFDADAWTPIGPGTVRDMLPFRIFDSFVHEQDMRRAVGRPGGWDGAAAVVALDRIVAVLPMVVGKRVSPPDGTWVELHSDWSRGTGWSRSRSKAAVPVSARCGPDPPVARLQLDGDTFVRLSTGRGDPDAILAGGRGADRRRSGDG